MNSSADLSRLHFDLKSSFATGPTFLISNQVLPPDRKMDPVDPFQEIHISIQGFSLQTLFFLNHFSILKLAMSSGICHGLPLFREDYSQDYSTLCPPCQTPEETRSATPPPQKHESSPSPPRYEEWEPTSPNYPLETEQADLEEKLQEEVEKRLRVEVQLRVSMMGMKRMIGRVERRVERKSQEETLQVENLQEEMERMIGDLRRELGNNPAKKRRGRPKGSKNKVTK